MTLTKVVPFSRLSLRTPGLFACYCTVVGSGEMMSQGMLQVSSLETQGDSDCKCTHLGHWGSEPPNYRNMGRQALCTRREPNVARLTGYQQPHTHTPGCHTFTNQYTLRHRKWCEVPAANTHDRACPCTARCGCRLSCHSHQKRSRFRCITGALRVVQF